ncbi:hypothetical protein HDU93_003917, partial [Gonapodya sp. JEL0774]
MADLSKQSIPIHSITEKEAAAAMMSMANRNKVVAPTAGSQFQSAFPVSNGTTLPTGFLKPQLGRLHLTKNDSLYKDRFTVHQQIRKILVEWMIKALSYHQFFQAILLNQMQRHQPSLTSSSITWSSTTTLSGKYSLLKCLIERTSSFSLDCQKTLDRHDGFGRLKDDAGFFYVEDPCIRFPPEEVAFINETAID